MEITLTWALFWKVVLTVCGLLDAEKYLSQGFKIARKKSSASVSRFFLVKAWLLDIGLLGYVVFNYSSDTILLITRILPLFTIAYVYILTWQFYPYKCKGLKNFRKPLFYEFVVDSFRPKGKL